MMRDTQDIVNIQTVIIIVQEEVRRMPESQCVDNNGEKNCYYAELVGNVWSCGFIDRPIKHLPTTTHSCHFFKPRGSK